MPEVPAVCTTTAAGDQQIGDRVTWLAGWNYGEPSKIIKVQEFSADPEYVEITEEPEVVHSHYFLTRRFRKDRLACVAAQAITCRTCGKPILASTAPQCYTGQDCRYTRPGPTPRT